VSHSSEFAHHNPLCCFSTSNTKGKRIFRYRLSPESFGYALVRAHRNSNAIVLNVALEFR